MDSSRFDAVSKLFVQRRLSWRGRLAQTGSAVAVGSLAATHRADTSAQDAMPDAVAADGKPGPATLVVQSFQSGKITPKDGFDGRYTLTLEHGLGQTMSPAWQPATPPPGNSPRFSSRGLPVCRG